MLFGRCSAIRSNSLAESSLIVFLSTIYSVFLHMLCDSDVALVGDALVSHVE